MKFKDVMVMNTSSPSSVIHAAIRLDTLKTIRYLQQFSHYQIYELEIKAVVQYVSSCVSSCFSLKQQGLGEETESYFNKYNRIRF